MHLEVELVSTVRLYTVNGLIMMYSVRSAHHIHDCHDQLHPSNRRGSILKSCLRFPGECLQSSVSPHVDFTNSACFMITRLGSDVDDAGGSGPGSFDVRGNVWHLDCCNPEDTTGAESQGWLIFGAIFGWTNSATIGSVLSYIFYWLTAIVLLVFMKWREGRMAFFGRRSARGVERKTKRNSIRNVTTVPVNPHGGSLRSGGDAYHDEKFQKEEKEIESESDVTHLNESDREASILSGSPRMTRLSDRETLGGIEELIRSRPNTGENHYLR